MTGLVERLTRERFGGRHPRWQEGSWGESGQIRVDVAEDAGAYYYKSGERIFVQRKEGSQQEIIPFCYGCNTPAKVVSRYSPPVGSIHPGKMLSEGGTVHSFYCSKCDPMPSKEARIQDMAFSD